MRAGAIAQVQRAGDTRTAESKQLLSIEHSLRKSSNGVTVVCQERHGCARRHGRLDGKHHRLETVKQVVSCSGRSTHAPQEPSAAAVQDQQATRAGTRRCRHAQRDSRAAHPHRSLAIAPSHTQTQFYSVSSSSLLLCRARALCRVCKYSMTDASQTFEGYLRVIESAPASHLIADAHGGALMRSSGEAPPPPPLGALVFVSVGMGAGVGGR